MYLKRLFRWPNPLLASAYLFDEVSKVALPPSLPIDLKQEDEAATIRADGQIFMRNIECG